jgi:hypothetical protein
METGGVGPLALDLLLKSHPRLEVLYLHLTRVSLQRVQGFTAPSLKKMVVYRALPEQLDALIVVFANRHAFPSLQIVLLRKCICSPKSMKLFVRLLGEQGIQLEDDSEDTKINARE